MRGSHVSRMEDEPPDLLTVLREFGQQPVEDIQLVLGRSPANLGDEFDGIRTVQGQVGGTFIAHGADRPQIAGAIITTH